MSSYSNSIVFSRVDCFNVDSLYHILQGRAEEEHMPVVVRKVN